MSNQEKNWLAREIDHVFTPAFRHGFSCGITDAKNGAPPPAQKTTLLRWLLTRYANAVWRAGYAVGYEHEKKWGLRNKSEKPGEVK